MSAQILSKWHASSMIDRFLGGSIRSWTAITVSGASLLALYYTSRRSKRSSAEEDDLLQADDPENPLLLDHVKFYSYSTNFASYPSIRKFYRPHAHQKRLQVIADLPLLIFIHGFGGNLLQFAPLLGSLSKIAPCFGIELPGHGCSKFEPTDYAAYKYDSFVDLWAEAINQACEEHGHKSVILVGHSMGCSISASLAAKSQVKTTIAAIIAICPMASGFRPADAANARRVASLPDWLVNILLGLDQLGGKNSPSVKRFVGESAGHDLKQLQIKFNRQMQTRVFKRTILGIMQTYDSHGIQHGGMPGRETWQEVDVPILLIAGEGDKVTKPTEIGEIVSFLQQKHYRPLESRRPSTSLPLASGTMPPSDNLNNNSTLDPNETTPETTHSSNKPTQPDDRIYGTIPNTSELSSHHAAVIKTAILPSPAAHALMYDHATYRTVAGIIEDFLARHVSEQLSYGWQLQKLTTSGKWDVKNLEKWKKVVPVSKEIDRGLFRALKTLREQDEEHTPNRFVPEWRDKIFAVVDISHDSPIYDTTLLEKGGIQYHKFPTVSKIPPTVIEVRDFIALVDRLRKDESRNGRAIAVHCHYGYNRTGFFIVCYLMERRGYRIQDAIEQFARAKPPGIRHDHFIDTLYMRYCVGLKKAPTFKND